MNAARGTETYFAAPAEADSGSSDFMLAGGVGIEVGTPGVVIKHLISTVMADMVNLAL